MSKSADLSALGEMPVIKSSDDMRKQLEEEMETQKDQDLTKQEQDPRTKEEYVFDFEWRDGRGKVWRGRFKNQILSIGQQQLAGALQAQMGGGQPYNTLDGLTQEINLMVAWMTFSLDQKQRPLWALDFRAIKNVSLLQALYQEVASHEATFHGLGETETPSKKDD